MRRRTRRSHWSPTSRRRWPDLDGPAVLLGSSLIGRFAVAVIHDLFGLFIDRRPLFFGMASALAYTATGNDRTLATDLVAVAARSEEHTSELQSLMSISTAVFCWKYKQSTTLYTAKA